MKIYNNNLSNFFKNFKASCKPKAILLYGPDIGQASLIFETLAKLLKANIVTHEYSEINNKNLKCILNTNNLFGSPDLIKVTDVTASINADAKSVLLAGDYQNFIVFIAEDLPKTSSLRKLFETDEHLAAIACYAEELPAIRNVILQRFAQHDLKITNDALNYLAEALRGDRYFIENEIAKIITFTWGRGYIDLNDIKKIVSGEITNSPDDMIIAFALKQYEQYAAELDKLLRDDIQPIWIIRALIRYYVNLYFVKKKMMAGESFEAASGKLTPPIFFKYIAAFRNIVNKLTLSEINNILLILSEVEIRCKTTGSEPKKICEHLIFTIQAKI